MKHPIRFIKQQLLLFEESKDINYGNQFIKGGYRLLI